MFTLPSGSKVPEGFNDEYPIVLEGTSVYDFRQLLRAMFCRPDIPGILSCAPPPTTFREWTSVLRLTHRWEMSALHLHARKSIAKLDGVDAVNRLSLALTYDIEDWIHPALADIIRREEPLARRHVDVLGVDMVLKLARAREHVAGYFGSCAKAPPNHHFFRLVSEVFPEYFFESTRQKIIDHAIV
ncbi:hypothetical protein CONPUDRAFT_167651 [Coniophora puteana RWD-64-598 SS2]|uniref:BTB domain-containing protein n=1 Tax=Coniophora puteana (strain RWD-64-598) TaxID=741705 RepID=A0A5M3MHJ9_CONPW|nr:uncharacterized protein CONPUDRAFT_167651 [Coniophora puteana RWD-64-598 SS2]EIW78708.1 hypothetical protein CONPUDRAFT_167651 [Coniophora puteana RWD-64-598 SS2]